MTVDTFVRGPLENNVYLVADEASGEALVIDPAIGSEDLLEIIAGRGLKLRWVVNTHGHFDHVGENAAFLAGTDAQLAIHRADLESLRQVKGIAAFYGCSAEKSPDPDRFLEDGDELVLGSHTFRVTHTPGHSPGGVCLIGHGVAFVGDTVFEGSVGRTDLPGSSHEELMESLRKLSALPEETVVYAGHGPPTTIGKEKKHNPFLQEVEKSGGAL